MKKRIQFGLATKIIQKLGVIARLIIQNNGVLMINKYSQEFFVFFLFKSFVHEIFMIRSTKFLCFYIREILLKFYLCVGIQLVACLSQETLRKNIIVWSADSGQSVATAAFSADHRFSIGFKSGE